MVAFTAINNNNLPAGFRQTTNDPDPIYDRFGLKRASTSIPWVYDHGIAHGGKPVIGTLQDVVAAAREPDFAELLKAAITAGCLAKGAPNFGVRVGGPDNYQYGADTAIDYQVLQIMANLIDQQDADSFPTAIQINSGASGKTVVYGVEDLPYIYRYHMMAIVDQLPVPLISGTAASMAGTISGAAGKVYYFNNQYNYPAGGTTGVKSPTYGLGANVTISYKAGRKLLPAEVSTFKSGEVTVMMVPDLWNPTDSNSTTANPTVTSALRPTAFRLSFQTTNPENTQPYLAGVESNLNATTATVTTDPVTGLPVTTKANITESDAGPTHYNWPISPVVQIPANSTSTTLQFSDGNGTLFREPTIPWRSVIANINLSAVTPNAAVTDANTGQAYYGMTLGKVPISVLVGTTAPFVSPDPVYIIQGTAVSYLFKIPATSGTTSNQFFVTLQCQDSLGNWIPYDTGFCDPTAKVNAPNIVAGPGSFVKDEWKVPFQDQQIPSQTSEFDPRTARWGGRE